MLFVVKYISILLRISPLLPCAVRSGATAKVVSARQATDIPLYPWITSIISVSGGLHWTKLLASRQCFFFFFLFAMRLWRKSIENHLHIVVDGYIYLFIHYPILCLLKMLQEYCIFVQPDIGMGCPEYIRSCMEDCWAELPEQRPDFPTIRDRLRKMREGM